MITAKIKNDTPYIKGTITPPAMLKGIIRNEEPIIKGIISNDVKREAYYEVSNEYGTTIIIGG